MTLLELSAMLVDSATAVCSKLGPGVRVATGPLFAPGRMAQDESNTSMAAAAIRQRTYTDEEFVWQRFLRIICFHLGY
jgi:hypothetical protein